MMVYPACEVCTKAPTTALVLQYMIFVCVSIQSQIAYFLFIPDFFCAFLKVWFLHFN